MKKTIIPGLLICTVFAVNAQNKCHYLPGNWNFTRWQMEGHLILDTEDSVATIKSKLQEYKEAHNRASMPAADSVELITQTAKQLARIRTNGFISFTLNKDKTFSWKGSVKDPNEQFSGTYSCNEKTIILNAKKGNDSHQIILQIISVSKNRITIQFPSDSNSDPKNNRMSFKRM